jgi:LacI family transcriptional regulator
MPTMSKPKVRSKRLTLADVAKASGFSPSTVSIVLNEAPLSRYVAATTKQRIHKTAKRLGYRPDVFARSLRSQRSHTIGILVIGSFCASMRSRRPFLHFDPAGN